MATYEPNGPYTKGNRLNDALRYGAQPRGRYSAPAPAGDGYDALERLLAAAKGTGADYVMIAIYGGKRAGDGASMKPYDGRPAVNPAKGYSAAGKQQGAADAHLGGAPGNCPRCGFDLAPLNGSSIDDKVLGNHYHGAPAGGKQYKQSAAREGGSYRN